ncbi:aminotransferase class V-fold PLP-dependent enzyme [Pseudactinotalea sp.]|uniref:aminotransferase class V-fold PLP-dependent enzyme n=1 Tax=Pseudactinotalea sp. TaxID=1926260 RepID=UPI003B3AB163
MLLTLDGQPASDLWPDSGFVHLNHGSYGRVPSATMAHQRALQRQMEHGPMGFLARTAERIALAREEIAPYLGVPAHTLALVPNASAGVSTALRSLPLPTGSEVVVTDHAYGAVRMGVERTAREAGAQVVEARVPLVADARDSVEAVWSAVTDRTAMIVIDHLTSGTARLLPVAEICARAREHGILTIVDGAHVPLLLDEPLQGVEADVWVGNLHKFGATPRGTAVLVAHASVADRLWPLIDSWAATDAYPQRFDLQGSQDYTAWLSAPWSLRHLDETIGWDRIRQHATLMADLAVAQVSQALSERYPDEASVAVGMSVGPIRLIGLPASVSVDPAQLRGRFLDAGVEAAFTTYGDRLFWRYSGHAYSTAADIDAMIDRGLPLLGLTRG